MIKVYLLSGTMMLDLADSVSQLERWENGRALLVYGADNTFCSGGDLDLMKALIAEPDGGASMSAFMHDTLLRLIHVISKILYGVQYKAWII